MRPAKLTDAEIRAIPKSSPYAQMLLAKRNGTYKGNKAPADVERKHKRHAALIWGKK